MREAGRIVAKVHAALREAIQPGVTTQELDEVAFAVLQKYNAVSAFLGYRGYPANICASVNDELVHGIPEPEDRAGGRRHHQRRRGQPAIAVSSATARGRMRSERSATKHAS